MSGGWDLVAACLMFGEFPVLGCVRGFVLFDFPAVSLCCLRLLVVCGFAVPSAFTCFFTFWYFAVSSAIYLICGALLIVVLCYLVFGGLCFLCLECLFCFVLFIDFVLWV